MGRATFTGVQVIMTMVRAAFTGVEVVVTMVEPTVNIVKEPGISRIPFAPSSASAQHAGIASRGISLATHGV